MRTLVALLLVSTATWAIAPLETRLVSEADTSVVAGSLQILDIRDARALGRVDSTLWGVVARGVFEERAQVRYAGGVREVAKALLTTWSKPSKGSIPVRIELLSWEVWTESVTGPDPMHARCQLRAVSLDTNHRGSVLSSTVTSEHKGVHLPEDVETLLRESLRDALASFGSSPVYSASNDTISSPAPSVWTNIGYTLPARPEARGVRQNIAAQVHAGIGQFLVGARYAQHLTPLSPWTPEYWGGFRLRGPWVGDYRRIWSGEGIGGLVWLRRLDDGASDWIAVGSVGGLLGYESLATQTGRLTQWFYTGGEGRIGVRRERENDPLTLEGGAAVGLRLPSRLAWIDAGLYLDLGWSF